MFGQRWKKKFLRSLDINIELLGLLEEVNVHLPKEKQQELDYKVRLVIAKHTDTVDGELQFRK